MAEKTNNTLIWVIGVILAVLCGIYFIVLENGLVSLPEVPAGPIRIGVITPLSGEKAEIGAEIQKTYNLVAENLDAAGGINGRLVELIYVDGKCEAQAAREAATSLIQEQKVHFILGGTCSEETLAAAEITEKEGILLLSSSAASPEIASAGDLVFRTYPAYDFEVMTMVEYAATELKAEKLALLMEKTTFSDRLQADLQAKANELGVELVINEVFDPAEADFEELIGQTKDERPDATFLVVESVEVGEELLEEIGDQGLRGEVFASNTLLDRSRFKKNPGLYRDLILTEVVLDKDNEVTNNFLNDYHKKYGEDPTFEHLAAASFDGFNLLAEGIGQVGTNSQEIASYFLENVHEKSGALGTLSFDENGDLELSVQVIQVQRDSTTKTLN